MHRVAEEAGFSLVELLAVLVISGVIAGALFQIVGAQGRFVEMQSGREEVQQNARAALELIGTELRTVPPGEALVRADDDSVTFRTPRIWGVVCAIPAPTTLHVAMPTIAGTDYVVNPGTGATVNLGSAATPLWSSAVAVTAIANASGTCNGNALPAGTEMRALTLAAQPVNGATTPAVGNNLYLYDLVTYGLGTSAGVPGTWIQRRLGDGAGSSSQPMAGPVPSGGAGLDLSYFSDASAAALPVPITSAATRADVTRVQVVVQTVSRNTVGDVPETTTDTVIISLRNRL